MQILVLALASLAGCCNAKKPRFCRSLDCPKYTLLNKTETFEVRQYDASRWASYSTSNLHDLNKAMSAGFRKLFSYISGANEAGQKIAMTAPVRTKIVPGEGPYCADTFTISFMVPFAVETPPKPTDPEVFLEEDPAAVQFVGSFGGYASNEDWTKCLHTLAENVKDVGDVETDHWFTAGYDSPFQFWNRHNECWLTKA